MAALDDALKLASKDPPLAFVGLAVAGAKPPQPSIVVKTKGRTLVLPAWTGEEWGWYGRLAFKLASSMPAKEPVGQRSVDRATSNLLALHPAMQSLGTVRPGEKQAFDYYIAANKLVIAASAATAADSRGKMALDAFGSAVVEAPRTLLDAITKDIPREAAKVLNDVFKSAAQGFGLGNLSIGMVLVGGAVLWMFINRKGR
jgi:hypothetical protein